MTWLHRYRLRGFFRESIWVFPVISILASFATVRVCYWLDQWIG